MGERRMREAVTPYRRATRNEPLSGLRGGLPDHVAELLTFSAEKRLARVLLRLAHLDRNTRAIVELPI